MAGTYSNHVDSKNLKTALAAGAYAANDEININQFATIFETQTGIAQDILKMTLGPGWYGGFDSPLTFICNQGGTGYVDVRGGNEDFTMGSVATADVHNEVFVKLPRSNLLTYANCTMSKLRFWGGRMYVSDDCIGTDILQMAGDLELSEAAAGLATTTLLQKGGSLINNRTVTTGTVDGDAKLTMDNSLAIFGNLYFAGRELILNRGSISTKLTAYKGIIDMRGAKAAFTITDYLIGEDVKVYLPPKNIMANPFTNSAKFIGAGPTIIAAS